MKKNDMKKTTVEKIRTKATKNSFFEYSKGPKIISKSQFKLGISNFNGHHTYECMLYEYET